MSIIIVKKEVNMDFLLFDLLIQLLVLFVFLADFILLITFTSVYFGVTRKHSVKFKAKASRITWIILFILLINAILFLAGGLCLVQTGDIQNLYEIMELEYIFVMFDDSFFNIMFIFIFIFSLIGLVLNYLLYQGLIRGAQSLSHAIGTTGFSYIRRKFSFKKIDWKLIIITTLVCQIWTIIIFSLFEPIANLDMNIALPDFNIFLILYSLITICIWAPIKEELIYRFLYINVLLKWFGKPKSKFLIGLAFVIPTIIWTLLHTYSLQNSIVKYIQVLPLGLILSYIYYKKDVEHCIFIHMAFNISSLFVALLI